MKLKIKTFCQKKQNLNYPIDLVVTYVDNSDSVWQKNISEFDVNFNSKRYRNWNILKYWLRAVEQNMSFVRKIYFVVSNIEQIPKWLNQTNIHVVLHKDIIPENLLPTFNSTTIEMFLHRINGLAEHFIYSNDDMFPINLLQENDFFENELPVYDLIRRTEQPRNIFRMQCKNSYRLASQLANIPIDQSYFYIQHSMDPMLKSICEEVHQKASSQILKKCTKFREPFNYTQYLFPIYSVLTKQCIFKKYSFAYFNISDTQGIENEIKSKTTKIICINDSQQVNNFKQVYDFIHCQLNSRFPNKSRFELQ